MTPRRRPRVGAVLRGRDRPCGDAGRVDPPAARKNAGDLTSLQGHFEAALALVLRNFDDMAALRELGAQHVHWGARPEDYVAAREALIAAIRALAPSWDAALEGHWRSAITAIVEPMLEGAASLHGDDGRPSGCRLARDGVTGIP